MPCSPQLLHVLVIGGQRVCPGTHNTQWYVVSLMRRLQRCMGMLTVTYVTLCKHSQIHVLHCVDAHSHVRTYAHAHQGGLTYVNTRDCSRSQASRSSSMCEHPLCQLRIHFTEVVADDGDGSPVFCAHEQALEVKALSCLP